MDELSLSPISLSLFLSLARARSSPSHLHLPFFKSLPLHHLSCVQTTLASSAFPHALQQVPNQSTKQTSLEQLNQLTDYVCFLESKVK
jgi:hypothetical protein